MYILARLSPLTLVLLIIFGMDLGADQVSAQPCAPEITSVVPSFELPSAFSSPANSVFVGTNTAIAGRCLGIGGDATLGRSSAAIISWSQGEIIVHVPPDTMPGEQYLKIASDNATNVVTTIHVFNFSLPAIEDQVIPGEVHIRIVAGADAAAVSARHGGGIPQQHFTGFDDPVMSRWWTLPIPKGIEIPKVIELAADPEVEWAKPNVRGKGGIAATPNDPRYLGGEQWGLNKVQASAAWDTSQGSGGVSIGIIDSGVEGSHTDLNDHMISQQDFTGTGLQDGCGHGTKVAGIGAAETNNGVAVAGMGWNTTFRSYKVIFDDCSGSNPQLLAGLMQSITDGVEIVNMSLQNYPFDAEVQNAIDSAWANGLLLAGAASNNNNNIPNYPGDYSNVITVAASDQSDNRSSQSNYGTWVEMAAPGTDIVTTLPGNSSGNGGTGTSFAAPHVAGTAALLMAMGLNNCAARTTMIRSADPIAWQGGGRLNAYRAVVDPRDCPLDVQTGLAWADFNADSKADYCRRVYASGARVKCLTSAGSSFGPDYSSGVLDWGRDEGRAWVDHNGGGRADFCRRIGFTNQSDSKLQCTLSTGAGFGSTYTSGVVDWGYHMGRAWVDHNGDGKVDYCRRVGNGPNNQQSYIRCALSTGAGFGSEYISGLQDWGYHPGRAWVDFNGDGLTDFCRRVGNGPNLVASYVKCTVSTGTGFGASYTSGIIDWGYDTGWAWVDHNADGRADYCRRVGNGPNNQQSYVKCLLSYGTGFYTLEVASGVIDWGYETGRGWAHFSGDNRADYCRRVGSGPNNQFSYVKCATSTGGGFGTEYISGVVDWGYDSGRAWADFTGPDPTRKADYCRRVGVTNQVSSYVRCTKSTGTGFTPEYSSGVIDWGYDD